MSKETEPIGYIRNCYLGARDGEAIFHGREDGITVPTLNGYAIIPMEEYVRLLKSDPRCTYLKLEKFRQMLLEVIREGKKESEASDETN